MNIKDREIVHRLAVLTSHYIGELSDLIIERTDKEIEGFDPEVRALAYQLYNSCQLTSESLLALILENKEWDAEILNRTVMEGTLKFLYLLDGDIEEMKRKCREYRDEIPDILALKDNKRLVEFLESSQVPNDIYWKPLFDLVMEQERVDEIKTSYDSAYRKRLNSEWSFSGLMRYFASSQNEGYRMLALLQQPYSIMCHLSHLDGVGLGVIRDRILRDRKRRVVVEDGHASRLLSDIETFSEIRTMRLLNLLEGAGSVLIKEIRDRYSEIQDLRKTLQDRFSKVEYNMT